MYVFPAVNKYWRACQEKLLHDIVEGKRGLVLGGDGRCDSPGYSAMYCSYTWMDLSTNKILLIDIVDKREVALKSANMEKLGFERSLKELLSQLPAHTVKEVVTDAHVQIRALMSKYFPSKFTLFKL